MSPTELASNLRSLPWTSPTTILAVVAALAFAGLGLRGLIDPGGAADSFGLRDMTGDGLAAMRATGARNLAVALIGLTLIALDARHALALVLMGAGLVATLDLVIVWQGVGLRVALEHAAYAALLWPFAAVVWMRGAGAGRGDEGRAGRPPRCP